MGYEHGIIIGERDTTVESPKKTQDNVQVVIGTAPIHLISNPADAVNKPILINSIDEAKEKIGYNYDFDNYTLCQSIYASLELFKVAPIVLINVLDPEVHSTEVTDGTLEINDGQGTLNVNGVLLDSIVVKSTDGTSTYTKNTDYTASFDNNGYPIIALTANTTIPSDTTSLKVEYKKLDPSKVTKTDIIGGYDSNTGKYTGVELIRQVFPRLGVVPGIISTPGWSHYPEVAAILNAKSQKIGGTFNAHNVLDVDSSTVKKYEDVPAWKNENQYSGERSTVLWPKVKVGRYNLWFSAVQSALMAYTDVQNDDVPFVSPSNKKIPISAAVLADGTEVYLDQQQANYLNGNGIVTVINWNGWRSWGNNTAAYPEKTNPRERFIAVRRVLDWWGNSFILAYFDRIDDPTNTRQIENLVDDENIRANGFIAKGQIVGAKIEYRKDMNSEEDILNGKIRFIQKIGVYSPTEVIENILEFDPTIITNAVLGGEQ